MDFQLDRGLFQFHFTDRHAILGVSVNAKEADIRGRYHIIARVLHPDSGKWKTDAERQLAVRLFSRLVTQAYSTLSKPSQLQEQSVVLELLGKRLVEEKNKLQIVDPLCQQLYQSDDDFELVYNRILLQLATQQFTDLTQSEQLINQISELNMVYLLRKQLRSVTLVPTPAIIPKIIDPANVGAQENATADTSKPSLVEGALRRAEDYMSRKKWIQAVLELRDAIGVEPNNVRAHTLLGLAYINQQQITMARLSLNKAIQLSPTDPQVMQAKQEFERLSKASNVVSDKAGAKKTEGFFGGLFGGKK